MSETPLRLPPAIEYGVVDCQIILAVADSDDEDRKPDARPATGTITLTPLDPRTLETDPKPLIVFRRPVTGTLDENGRLLDEDRKRKIYLPVGRYRVTYNISEVPINPHEVTVKAIHTEDDPLHLALLSEATTMPELTSTQYQELLDRISMIEGIDAGAFIVAWDEVTEKPTYFTTEWSMVANKPDTYPPVIGTTATTAKAGDYQPTWDQVTSKPATFAPIVGTTSTTAKAGDYIPTWSEVSGKPTLFPTDWASVSGKPSTFAPTIGTTAVTAKAGNYVPDWTEVTNKPTNFTTDWALVANKPATYPPTIGTTATTAKAGNYTPSWSEIGDKPSTFAPTIGTTAVTAKAGNYAPTWSEVTGKPTTFATDWGSVTSKPSVFPPEIGTTATTAKAGNYTPTWAEVTGKPSTFAPTIGTTSTTAKAGNYQPTWAQVTSKPTTFDPTPHAASHAKAGGDPITPASIGSPTAEELESLRTTVGQNRRLTPFHLALASQDTAACNVYVLGDSVSEGACSNTSADRWQSVMEKTLRHKSGGSGYIPAWTISPFVQKTGRFSVTPAPVGETGNPKVMYDTTMTSAGFAAKRIGVQGNGWAEWDFEGDRVRLWYSRTTFFGLSAKVFIDGQEVATLAGGGADVSSESWTSGLLSPGTHVIRIQELNNSNGAFWIEGTQGLYGDQASGVHVYDGARSGSKSEDYTASTPWTDSMSKISPSLVMLWFGYNDMNQRTPAQFKSNMTSVVNKIKATLTEGTYTLAIVAGWAPNPPPAAGWAAYVQAMEEVAASHPYGICIRTIDRWPVMNAGANNPGMFGNDTIHPSNAGQRLLGSHFADSLSLPENKGVFKSHLHSIDNVAGLEATLQDKANVRSVQDTGWVPLPFVNGNWSGQPRIRRSGSLVQFHVTGLNGTAAGSSLATLVTIPAGFRAPSGFTAHGVGATSSSTAVGAVAMTVTESGGSTGFSDNVRVSTPSSWTSGAGSAWWYTDEDWPTQTLLASLRGSGEQGGSITHAQIVARSARWFPPTGPTQVPYSRVDEFPDNDGHSYRADCSGFVSMCLHADRSYSTRSIDQISVPITKAQLQPGDYLNSYDNHVVLFLGWTDGTQTRYNARESSGPKGGTIQREVPYPYFAGSSPETYVPMKYINVSD